MMLVSTTVVTNAVGPTRASFRRLNSSPTANIKRMSPSSESVCTTSRSATSGNGQ